MRVVNLANTRKKLEEAAREEGLFVENGFVSGFKVGVNLSDGDVEGGVIYKPILATINYSNDFKSIIIKESLAPEVGEYQQGLRNLGNRLEKNSFFDVVYLSNS